MENIEDILRALADAPDNNEESETQQENNGVGLFDGLDPSMLITVMSLFETMNKTDDNERFLLALKPLLREENQSKIDAALKFMKLFSLLPLLKESGLLGKML